MTNPHTKPKHHEPGRQMCTRNILTCAETSGRPRSYLRCRRFRSDTLLRRAAYRGEP